MKNGLPLGGPIFHGTLPLAGDGDVIARLHDITGLAVECAPGQTSPFHSFPPESPA